MATADTHNTIATNLRVDAAKARSNYAEALSDQSNWAAQYAQGLHPAMLIAQAVGFEVAAGLHSLAAALYTLSDQRQVQVKLKLDGRDIAEVGRAVGRHR